MSRYAAQVADALAATAVRGPSRFAWKGRLNPRIDPPFEAQMSDAARRAHLTTSLSERLRMSWYCHGRAVHAEPNGSGTFVADQALVGALSAANSGRGTWEPGWTVERVEDGVVVGSNGRLRARIAHTDCRPLDGRLREGAAFAARLPKELPFYSPGFHLMFGDADLDLCAEQVRVYWNVTANQAVQLVRILTKPLNTIRIPFELKVAAHPLALRRCDAAVLYLSPDDFVAARETLLGVADAVPLRPLVPALTRELAPGVGLAEDVREGESFGTQRCALLAEAILRAHDEGVETPAGRLAAVAARFAEAGLALDAPYREPALDGRHVL